MILLRPHLIHLKHSLNASKQSIGSILRAGIIFFLLVALAVMIFGLMSWVLNKVLSERSFVSIPAELIFIFCFNLFLPMIFFTNLSTFIGNFYNSEDLELILSSPISKFKFFMQRTILTSLESSWMTVFSLMPFIFSICVSYQLSPLIIFILPLTLAVFMLVPASLASLVAIFWALLVPNIPPGIIILILLFGAFYIIKNVVLLMGTYVQSQETIDFTYINLIFSKIESFGMYWSPGTWAAKSLAPFFSLPSNEAYSDVLQLQNQGDQVFTVIFSILASISSIVLVFSLSYLLFLHFYSTSLSIMWGRKRKVLYSIGPLSNKLFKFVESFFPKHKKIFGIIKKEFVELTRDATQIVQLIFLTSFFAMYVYALQFQQSFQFIIGAQDSMVWRRVIFVLNFSIETFMLVALALRLTLPSLSREGRAAWIFQTSPVNAKTIVLSKLIVLTTPIIFMMSILSFFSHYVSTHDVFTSIMKATYIATVSISICCLSMYVGAMFAYFSWESRSQLIASVGSVVFMIFGLLFAFFIISLSFPLNPMAETYTITSKPYVFAYWLFIQILNVCLSVIFIKKATYHLQKKLHAVII